MDWLAKLKGLGPAGLRRTGGDLRVGDAVSPATVTVAGDETVRAAAEQLADQELAAAVVESEEPGILTARDVLGCVAAGGDPDQARVGDYGTKQAVTTSPGSSLNAAAHTMVNGDFRHLVVVDGGGHAVGVLAMRDMVRCWLQARATPPTVTPIREAMNTDFLTLAVDETIARAAHAMLEHDAPAAVAEPTEGRPYPGIFTEREVLHSLGAGGDPSRERLVDHLASEMTFSAPGWSLRQAAEAMTKGGFQHIVVVDRYEIRGVISMRDVVQRWAGES